MVKLAINGGTPVRDKNKLFPAYNPIGKEEKEAAMRVLDSGILSNYIGGWEPMFYGGPEVQAFEKEWAAKVGAKFGIAMNSASSGLIAAMGAIGIEPGDEVIVAPFSMCISATAPLFYGAIPVFADVEPEYLCLDPKSVEAKITPRTKAIITVDITGQPYDADAINAIAKKHNLKVIEDAAQAPGVMYKDRYAGTLGDIGVFSLNYHKHIHTGEGTVVVTDDPELAERLQLIRNHAEAVVEGKGITNLVNMLGQNYRLTELQAAIGRELLKKLDGLIEVFQKNSLYLSEHIGKLPGIRPAPTRIGATHSYYMHAFLFDEAVVGVSRNKFIAAVAAELPCAKMREQEGALVYPCGSTVYMLPIFQKQIAIGSKGFPFRSEYYDGTPNYAAGICPVAENLRDKVLFANEYNRPGMTKEDLDDVIEAFKKVYENRKDLV